MAVGIIDAQIWGSPPTFVVFKPSREEKWFCKTNVLLSGSSSLTSPRALAFWGEVWHDGDGTATEAETSTWWSSIGVVT